MRRRFGAGQWGHLHYLDNGANFILVGADVALLARGSEALAARYVPNDPVVEPAETPPSY